MRIGYARVSTDDQTLDVQRDALAAAGCEKIFAECASGATTARPELKMAFSHLRAGDTLVVWRLDRLGRSLRDLIAQAEMLRGRGVDLKSLQEKIDTCSPGGELVFNLFGSLAQFERNLIRERTRAGLAAARRRGRTGGCRKRLGAKKRQLAADLHRAGQHTVREICEMMGISRATLYEYIKEFSDGSQENHSR